MPNLDAPARLAFWPQRPWDEGSDYDTLRQALADAAQHPSETPWIVTQSGKMRIERTRCAGGVSRVVS